MTALMVRSDVPASLADQMQLASALAKSGLLPDHLRSKPENVLAIMFAATSVDIPLWQAVSGMQVISGKVGMSADLHRALILRAGHTFRLEDVTDKSATALGIRREDADRYEHRATFTIDDAKKAGLTGGSWNKYPKAMLVARATTMLARNAFSDVIAGMAYTPEELGAEVDEEGRVVVVPGDGIARNRDGTPSRRQNTDEQLRDAGVMDSQQAKEHRALVKDATAAERPAERVTEAPAVDEFTPAVWEPFDPADWGTRLDMTVNEADFARLRAELDNALATGQVDGWTFDTLKADGARRLQAVSDQGALL